MMSQTVNDRSLVVLMGDGEVVYQSVYGIFGGNKG